MAKLLDACWELFGSRDLYEVLSVGKKASPNEVKRGYHRVSLKVHPDRVSATSKEEATAKFQAISRAYTILSDPEKRAVYDETGDVGEDDVDENKDWMQYWRLLYKQISVVDIKEFEAKYRDSEMEKMDLKEAYIEHKGKMTAILESIPCSSLDDATRFYEMLKAFVDTGDLPKMSSFRKLTGAQIKSMKRKADAEAEEAVDLAAELGLPVTAGGNDDQLSAAIMKRQAARQGDADDFFTHLQDKYCNGKKGGGKKKTKK